MENDLVKYRDRFGITQKQLGIIIEASQSQVSKWERGINHPSKLRMDKIRKTLNDKQR